jgi:hypothetical protein
LTNVYPNNNNNKNNKKKNNKVKSKPLELRSRVKRAYLRKKVQIWGPIMYGHNITISKIAKNFKKKPKQKQICQNAKISQN